MIRHETHAATVVLVGTVGQIARFGHPTRPNLTMKNKRLWTGTNLCTYVRSGSIAEVCELFLMVPSDVYDPERSSEAPVSTYLRQCLPALDAGLAATCNHSRTTKFTNRPGTAISLTIVLPASSSFTRRSDLTSAISASVGMSASTTILCRSRPFTWMTYSR